MEPDGCLDWQCLRPVADDASLSTGPSPSDLVRWPTRGIDNAVGSREPAIPNVKQELMLEVRSGGEPGADHLADSSGKRKRYVSSSRYG